MTHLPAFSLDRDRRDYVIRVSADVFEKAELTRFLDALVRESIRKRGKLTEEDAPASSRER